MYGDSPEPGEPDPLVSEEVVGNVSKLCVLPPGYRGPPRKGHLIFDANFESGEFVCYVCGIMLGSLFDLANLGNESCDQ